MKPEGQPQVPLLDSVTGEAQLKQFEERGPEQVKQDESQARHSLEEVEKNWEEVQSHEEGEAKVTVGTHDEHWVLDGPEQAAHLESHATWRGNYLCRAQ